MKTTVVAGLVLAFMSGRAMAGEFTLHSPDLAGGRLGEAQFSNSFGCTGGNVSPEISWSGVPAGTKSFVVTMYDKDAPTGSGWWHWVVVDVPATAQRIERGAGTDPARLPSGTVMMTTDAGEAKFMGACPPPGETHAYTITVKALKVSQLPVPANATAAMVGFVSNLNALATATIVATGRR